MPTSLRRRDFLRLSLLGVGLTACRWLRLTTPPLSSTPSTVVSIPNKPSPFPPDETLASPAEATPITEPPPQTLPAQTESPFPAFIIDGHQDIAWNALELGRNPMESAYTIRKKEENGDLPGMVGERVTGLPEYLSGRVGIIFASLFVAPAQNAYPGYHSVTYSTPQQAEAHASQQLHFYHQLAETEPRLLVITSSIELQTVVTSWTLPGQQPLVGLVLVMEGADPILSPKDLPRWYNDGLRIIGPAWHATRYSAGTGKPGPLTDLGRQLLAATSEYNMILDLSHLAEAAALEAVESYTGPVIASHSNPKPILPSDRGLPDETIQKIVAHDGVVGIMLYNRFLKPGWVEGDSREQVTLNTVAEAIDYVTQLSGDARHVAIGSDFDGGFGLNAIPQEMDSVADLIQLADILAKRGFSREDIEAVANGNWLRILKQSLP